MRLHARPLPIIAAVTLALLAILYPPWTGSIIYHFGGTTMTQELNLGYAPIFAPPSRPALPPQSPSSQPSVLTSSVWISDLLYGELSIIAALVAIHVWWTTIQVQSRREQRSENGQCPQCGYDVTANTSDICPECGSTIMAIEPRKKT